MALNLTQVNEELRRYRPKYLGCFAIDQLPKKINQGEGLVSNFERSDQTGSHWVCCYYFPKKLIYYDSFGFPPPIDILALLKRSADRSFYTLPDFQSYTSDRCGMFCISFLKSAFDGKDPIEDMKLNFD